MPAEYPGGGPETAGGPPAARWHGVGRVTTMDASEKYHEAQYQEKQYHDRRPRAAQAAPTHRTGR